MFLRPINLLAIAACAALACGNPVNSQSDDKSGAQPAAAEGAAKVVDERGEAVTPPFAMTDELTGLLLVWFDAEGPHTANSRSEIPEAHRKLVRVDSLRIAPDKRLDPDHVYIADLTHGGTTRGYPVRKHTREFFDAQVQGARPPPPKVQAAASGDVTIYGASWCSACRGAAAYLRSHNVPFVEKDIEKDAQADAEMQQKARAAGKTPRGVPVIDFRGEIILGFSEAALDRLVAQSPQPI